MTDFSVEESCDALSQSFADDKEDPLQVMTMIDILSEEVDEKGTCEEKEQFLELLRQLLEENTELIGKIGWDLPHPLLRFCNPENFNQKLRLSECKIIKEFMACFNLIAVHGSPQECLVTALELLTTLNFKETVDECHKFGYVPPNPGLEELLSRGKVNRDGSPNLAPERDLPELIFGVKSYAVFELISSLIRRVYTLYPSKYLEEAVTAIREYVTNNTEPIEDMKFILRRVFAFCRGYIPPEPPRKLIEEANLSKEEYNKIMTHETEVQSKLLRNLPTFTVGYCVKFLNDKTEVVYFHDLIGNKCKLPGFYVEAHEIISRYYQLAYSFDIDVAEEFKNILKESRDIYVEVSKRIKSSEKKDRKSIIDILLRAGYYYEIQKTATEKDIGPDPKGIIVLSGFNYIENKEHLIKNIDIADAIYLYLRYSTESLFSPTCHNVTVEGISRYWIWVALTTTDNKTLKEKLSELPPMVLECALNMMLIKNCHQVNEELRMITFTLMTRLLCLIPEDTGYDFLITELEKCKVTFGKSCILGILRDLLCKDNTCNEPKDDVEQLSTGLASLKVNDNDLKSKTFINLNADRIKSINRIAQLAVEEVGKDDDKFNILLVFNYLKFFKALLTRWDKTLLKELCNQINDTFSKLDQNKNEVRGVIEANKSLESML
ncbi:Ybp1p [Nakaseomyces bracarensis]|uniref:Ybp1p n=1 Tax=Nakaseomyces bracarensis TaxID=273131 RepID=UPI003871B68D